MRAIDLLNIEQVGWANFNLPTFVFLSDGFLVCQSETIGTPYALYNPLAKHQW